MDNTTNNQTRKPYYVFGGGMSGIMQALHMRSFGHDIVLISSQRDPRFPLNRNSLEEEANFAFDQGASWSGGPTRMMSPREGDVYLGSTPVYPNMMECFQKTVSEGGWLDKSYEELNPREQKWIAKRAAVDQNEAYVSELREFYADANILGMKGWLELYQNPDTAHLFHGTHFKDGLIRSFDTEAKMQMAIEFYSNTDWVDGKDLMKGCAFRKQGTIQHRYPFLGDHKRLYGVLGIEGFSFNAQQFMRNALNDLEQKGAKFRFKTELTNLIGGVDNVITALEVENTETGQKSYIEDPKYVSLHMGAYDSYRVLDKTPAANSIMGVAGLWAEISTPEGMNVSMKAHFGRKNNRPLTDLNLILNGEETIVGGGYIFNGEVPGHITDESRRATYEAMLRGVRKLFPREVIDEKDIRMVEDWMCARSFSYDDLPILFSMPTAGGGNLTAWSGDNTGSTSIAPAAAHLVHSYTLGTHALRSEIKGLIDRYGGLRMQSKEILAEYGLDEAYVLSG